jgi:hypothetical protein
VGAGVGHPLYVNPSYVAELNSSIATATGTVRATLESMRSVRSSSGWSGEQKQKKKKDDDDDARM